MNHSNNTTYTSTQITASIINTTNDIRTTKYDYALRTINNDYSLSLKELKDGSISINNLIKSKRGGSTGIHGFIGERAQVYLSNSKSLVRGDIAHYTLLDDNGPTDYLYDSIMIQQKACRAGGNLGLDQIEIHANAYPFYVTSGGIYQIPKDFYEKYLIMSNTPKELASKLRKEDYRLWVRIYIFNHNNPDITIKPMDYTYDEIQANTINDTIQKVREDNKEIFLSRRELARLTYKATLKECIKVSSISATSEGLLTGGSCCLNKLRDKNLKEFNKEDYIDIGKASLKGAVMGALRSSTIYFITNKTKISTPTTSASFTATCGIIKEAKDFADGKTTKQEFATNSAWLCADAAVSVVASKFGTKYLQKVLPGKTKILAPVISNLIIMPIYNKAKKTVIQKTVNKEAYEDE